MDKISLRVPATTANLGPGFDCLGMALDIFNEITVAPASISSLSIQGEGAGQISQGGDNLVYRAMAAVFNQMGRPVPALAIACHNRIPLARGLGSSAAAIAGGLVAANELLGRPLSREDLLQLGAKLEGHADNVAPALLGGCQIVYKEAERFFTIPIPLPAPLKAILFIPDFAMPTDKARDILPAQVPRDEVVFNLGRVALLSLALATGKLEYLKVATQDKLHQPARQALFPSASSGHRPAMTNLFQAALEAGALGVFLSGSGSTVLALTQGDSLAQAIGGAMKDAAARVGLGGRVQVAAPTALGAHRIRTSP